VPCRTIRRAPRMVRAEVTGGETATGNREDARVVHNCDPSHIEGSTTAQGIVSERFLNLEAPPHNLELFRNQV
jgi:hypothetical protein